MHSWQILTGWDYGRIWKLRSPCLSASITVVLKTFWLAEQQCCPVLRQFSAKVCSYLGFFLTQVGQLRLVFPPFFLFWAWTHQKVLESYYKTVWSKLESNPGPLRNTGSPPNANGEPSSARWQYWSLIKDVSFCFEKKLRVKNQSKQLFIRDQYCHLVVKAPHFIFIWVTIFYDVGFLKDEGVDLMRLRQCWTKQDLHHEEQCQ